MGTRGLTCVVLKGEYKICQYGQWDHYPSGQGVTVLDFLTNKMDRERFESALKETTWITEAALSALYVAAGNKSEDGWVTAEVSDNFKDANPQLDRDMGAAVLEFVQESDMAVVLNDNIEFAQDGLMCEWAYVIDLDKNVLEVYQGFGKEELDESSRFGNDIDDNGYSTIGLTKTYSLDDLPDERTFLRQLDPNEDDEDVSMDKEAIFAVLDRIRSGDHGDDIINDRICNYMEANIDEFIETYEMVDRTD